MYYFYSYFTDYKIEVAKLTQITQAKLRVLFNLDFLP